jgi:phosphatidylglycerophosphatase A
MRKRAAHWIAFAFGAGLSPIAPGTIATLFAAITYTLIAPHLHNWQIGLILFVGFIVGVWAAYKTAQRLEQPDPGSIVIDEVVAFWLILWLASPVGFWGYFWTFITFRFFDSVKPGPIGWVDRRLKGFGWRGGLGIMLDDLVAAFFTLLLIALWRVL